MTSPYRDPERACPACKATLREFRGRLCCDACSGIMLGLADLTMAIEQLTRIAPDVKFIDDPMRGEAGSRNCPHCAATMTPCRLDVTLLEDRPKLKPELDRCGAHGVWFDNEELAKVLEVLRRAVSPKGGGGAAPSGFIEGYKF
jgi:Zn-finger nucleic acid-binding protein